MMARGPDGHGKYLNRRPPKLLPHRTMEGTTVLDRSATLPPELLSEIFSWCDKGVIWIPPPSTPTSLESICVPELVCSRWRSAALQTPALWENVTVIMPCRKSVWLLPRVRTLLMRGTKKLNLWLDARDQVPLAVDEMVRQFSQQLTHLRVGCACSMWLHVLLASPPFFDALTSIDLVISMTQRQTQWSPPEPAMGWFF